MRHGMTTQTMLSALLIAQGLATADVGPAKCIHTTNRAFNIYKCSGVRVTIIDQYDKVVINCYGQFLDCSKLQQFSYKGSKTLKQLYIIKCSVNSSLECVLDSLNATGVTSLSVQDGLTPVTEKTVQGLDMLKTFLIVDGVQFTVPVEALERLPNLSTFQLLNNNISTISSNMFKEPGIPELLSLDVSNNNITTLPADAFNGLDKLTKLIITTNNCQEVDKNAFRGLDSLEMLYLNENSFSVLPSDLFVNVPLLQNLTILQNIKELRVQEGAISGLPHLLKLELSSMEELKLDNASLSNLKSLKTLILSKSNIRELPADLLIGTTAVVELFLNNNSLRSLPESVFSGLVNLEKLDLSSNKLKRVTVKIFKSLGKLQEIYLDNNNIETLPEELFNSLTNLAKVSISKNRISSIDPLAFNVMVLNLNLAHNQLNWSCIINNSAFDPERKISMSFIHTHSPLNNLINIHDLNLSNNSISNVCSDWTDKMTQLKVLDLSHNKLTKILNNINFVSEGIKVDLRDNQITSITYKFMRSNPSIKFGRNPFHCDCSMYEFLKELRDPFDLEDATCNLPQSLNGVALRSIAHGKLTDSVSLTNFTCPSIDMLHNCFCIVRPAMNRTECDCQDIQNNILPDPTLNGPAITGMRLTLKTKEHVHFIPKFVQELDLSSLRLTSVPLEIPETVKHVDLRNNELSSVPLEFLQRNITLTLENNPLKCGCWEADDVKHLQKYQMKIIDYKNLFCSDEELYKVNAESLCDKMQAVAIGSSLALFGLIIAICVALAYKYSVEVKVYLYNKGWLASKYIDTKKEYDIFVSFAHVDSEFVENNLLPELEKYYKVCKHSRDWVIGARIVDQIAYSVEQSRRTLIVLSNACLPRPGKTTWVLAEFEAAVMQTQQDQLQRAVVVLLEEVNFDNAPELIRNHVKMNTYITWGETLFWEKLRKALPRKLKVEDVKRKRAAKCLGNGGLNVVLNNNGVLVNAFDLKDNVGTKI